MTNKWCTMMILKNWLIAEMWAYSDVKIGQITGSYPNPTHPLMTNASLFAHDGAPLRNWSQIAEGLEWGA